MVETRTSARRLIRFISSVACPAALAASAVLWPGPALAQPRPEAQAVEPATVGAPTPVVATLVEGFRQARFGMTEPEVRQAIRRDFPVAAGRLSRVTHPSERTTVLTITVEGLLLDAGSAQLSYILGYASKRLVQVNIAWASDGRSTARDEAIVAAANTLRDHFRTQHRAPPDEVLINQQVDKNAFLVFRAAQADGRMVVLLLSGVAASGRADRTPAPPPLTLQLSYIRDRESPDIFRIERGRF